MYNNAYYNQANLDRINNQIAELEKIKSQMSMPQPTNLTQNFQIAPTSNHVMKYANSIDEVQKDIVIGDTPYFSKDMTIVWVKNSKGEIRTFELNEIVPKDNKDLMIENLQLQIKELRKEIQNAKSNDDVIDEPIENEKSTTISNSRKSAKK